MPNTPLQDQVHTLVDEFVHDITELVRTAAFGALDAALRGPEESTPTAERRSRQRRELAPSVVEVIMTPAPAGRITPPADDSAGVPGRPAGQRAPSSMPRTQPALDEAEPEIGLEQRANAIVAHLGEHPDLRAEELARALKAEPGHVKRALAALKADERVQASGKARGTRYRVTQEDEEELRPVEMVCGLNDPMRGNASRERKNVGTPGV